MENLGESLTAATRYLKKTSMKKLISDDRVTPHGYKILERWAQEDLFTLQRLERRWDEFMAVLLEQQTWEHPSTYEQIEWQRRNGLTIHEIRELGQPDLSCRAAIQRMKM